MATFLIVISIIFGIAGVSFFVLSIICIIDKEKPAAIVFAWFCAICLIVTMIALLILDQKKQVESEPTPTEGIRPE